MHAVGVSIAIGAMYLEAEHVELGEQTRLVVDQVELLLEVALRQVIDAAIAVHLLV